eukprot:TRINITY_DN8349_c0_g1_i2.p1 TRINITY_DN8349_c0_g1~~TRINITY_DN8349_c0_g1_i2.p1  ORF type:complete len:447 (+),score=83.25 TRINITY_DN8349_c0_g1_i2:86-1426(+)
MWGSDLQQWCTPPPSPPSTVSLGCPTPPPVSEPRADYTAGADDPVAAELAQCDAHLLRLGVPENDREEWQRRLGKFHAPDSLLWHRAVRRDRERWDEWARARSHAERCIARREAAVAQLRQAVWCYDAHPAVTSRGRCHLRLAAARSVGAMQRRVDDCTREVAQAVGAWKRAAGRPGRGAQFLWRGENYLRRMLHDCDFYHSTRASSLRLELKRARARAARLSPRPATAAPAPAPAVGGAGCRALRAAAAVRRRSQRQRHDGDALSASVLSASGATLCWSGWAASAPPLSLRMAGGSPSARSSAEASRPARSPALRAAPPTLQGDSAPAPSPAPGSVWSARSAGSEAEDPDYFFAPPPPPRPPPPSALAAAAAACAALAAAVPAPPRGRTRWRNIRKLVTEPRLQRSASGYSSALLPQSAAPRPASRGADRPAPPASAGGVPRVRD